MIKSTIPRTDEKLEVDRYRVEVPKLPYVVKNAWPSASDLPPYEPVVWVNGTSARLYFRVKGKVYYVGMTGV